MAVLIDARRYKVTTRVKLTLDGSDVDVKDGRVNDWIHRSRTWLPAAVQGPTALVSDRTTAAALRRSVGTRTPVVIVVFVVDG